MAHNREKEESDAEAGCGLERRDEEMKNRIRTGGEERGEKKQRERIFAAFVRAHLRLERYNAL